MKSTANAPAGVDSGTLDANDYLDAVAVTYANGTTGSITDMHTVVFVSGVTIQDGNNSLQIKLTDYPDVPAYTVTIPSASVDSATV